MRNVQDICPNDLGDVRENLPQSLRVVRLIDIFKIFLPVLRRLGETDIVNIETERFGKGVESLKTQFAHGLDRFLVTGLAMMTDGRYAIVTLRGAQSLIKHFFF